MGQMKLFENSNEDSKEKGIHPMNQILEEFSLENPGRDIYDQIRKLLPGVMRGHARVKAICKLLLVKKKLIFRTQFSEIYINCQTEKYLEVDFYLTDILEVLKNDRNKVLSFKILPENLKVNNIKYLDEPYTRFKGRKEEQETFFIEDPHGNILELKTLQNS